MSYLKSAVATMRSLDIGTAALLPSIIGMMLAAELDATEQEILGNFLPDIGATLSTIASLIEAQKGKDDGDVQETKNDQITDENQSLKDDQEKMQRQM